MPSKDHDINIYILTGGKSSRMNFKPKALLEYQGESFLQRIIKTAKMLTDQVTLIGDQDFNLDFGPKVIKDKFGNIGPCGGLLTALAHSKAQFNMILSCDNPLLQFETLDLLLENATSDAICYFRVAEDHYLFPLLIPGNFYTKLKDRIELGHWRLWDNVKTLGYRTIDCPAEMIDDFININTPLEYKRMIDAYKS